MRFELFHDAISLHQSGRLVEAERAYRAALEARPDHVDTLHMLGLALHQLGRSEDAETQMRRALALAPDRADVSSNLGAMLGGQGRLDEAHRCLERAVRLAPAFADGWANLAMVLERSGRPDDALAAAERAIIANPNHADALNTLGRLHYQRRDIPRAIDHWRRAVAANRSHVDAMTNLGGALTEEGLVADALVLHRRVLELQPTHAPARSSLLLTLHYDPAVSPRQLAEEHFRFGQVHEPRVERIARAPQPPASAPHVGPSPPARRDLESQRVLRIAYVSPHLRRHAVAVFAEGLLRSHDRERFHITCYSDVRAGAADDLTAALRGYCDQWHDTAHLSDQQLAQRVAADQQDILVDLAGHLGSNRLLAFARKPAPVQVTYLGYQNTTGLRAMDYRITDAVADPPGASDALHTERLFRLPCFFAYGPPALADDVAPLPALSNGFITFGSLNAPPKFNDGIIQLWSRLLQRAPRSRLMLLTRSAGGEGERSIVDRFAACGIGAERLRLFPRGSHADYLRQYHQVDIALDPHPFSGHTTTCDALWMGVPVVTLAGATYASRMTASVLAHLPMPELITETPGQYVDRAAALAGDVGALAALRRVIRPRMRTSVITDAVAFTRSIEAAYREMWVNFLRDGDKMRATT